MALVQAERVTMLPGPPAIYQTILNADVSEYDVSSLRLAVTGAHVTPGQALFALANTDIMWVCAEVPERDWRTLNNNSQRELVVRVPSMPDSEAVAHVKFTEGNVSPETHTVAIVGELDNGKKQFRPGMFVWVSMPVGHPRQALAVPASAIVNHEQSKLVFIADGSDTFHVVNVTTGIETPGWVEVTGGLKGGETVVDQGTFVLKSELLLEREAE